MQILLNDKYVGIHYINLKRNENIIEDKLVLKIDKKYRQDILNLIECDGKLSIIVQTRDKKSFCLYTVAFSTIYIYLLEEHNFIEEILLDVYMTNNENSFSNSYNQFIVDIFYSWSNDIELKWDRFNSIEIKDSYLKACYLWSSKLFKIKNINNIHLEGELIQCEQDLYYYLGEYFFGKRGFLGSSLDSLEDFLIDIVKNNTINTTIVFNNVDIIIRNTSKYFFETVIYLLEKSKFRVEIISSMKL